MSLFGRHKQRNDLLPSDEYAESLAVWQIQNSLNSHDMTPAQAERYRLFIRIEDTGLDPKHVAYARWLLEHGRIDGPTEEMLARAAAIPSGPRRVKGGDE